MNLLTRIILSAIIAAVSAAVLNTATSADTNVFAIDTTAFVIIFIGNIIVALVSPIIKTPSKPAAGKKSAAKRHKRKPSGKGREQGQVKWFNVSKGYGFVTRSTGEDIFVHFRSILGEGRRVLREGQTIEFTVTEGDKGPQAEDVKPL